MSMDKEERIIFPRRGELVVATVKEIVGHGAYLHIEDYNIEGYLPITEVSTKFVRDIEDVIKEGQKIVVKVIRIDKFTKSVDVSYKDVSETEKNKILRLWKRNQRGIRIIKEAEKHLKEKGININLEEKLEPIIDREQTVYDALENIMLNPGLLDEVGLSNIKNDLIEFFSKKIHLKKYFYEAVISVSSIRRGGVYRIKEALGQLDKELASATKLENTEIVLIGSPRYRLTTWSYKPETIKKKVIPTVNQVVKKLGKKGDVNIEILEENLKTKT